MISARPVFVVGAKFLSKKCGLCGHQCVCVHQSNDKIYLYRVRTTVILRVSIRSKVYVNLKCIYLMWSGHLIIGIYLYVQLKLIFAPQIFLLLLLEIQIFY